MARIHAHRRGRSGSKRPTKQRPDWSPLSPGEVEKQVIALTKEGKTTSGVGTYLRDQFGVPSVRGATGKKVTKILAASGQAPKLPEDVTNLLKRVVDLQEHLAKHPKDLNNSRQLELAEAKIRRLSKYYVRTKRLPDDWKYSRKTVKLLLQ